jgi:deoxyribodipyrimidine photo-lyase
MVQGWGERAVFGKIRFMNYAGCKRKFNIPAYVAYASKLVREDKQQKQKLLGTK